MWTRMSLFPGAYCRVQAVTDQGRKDLFRQATFEAFLPEESLGYEACLTGKLK